MRLPSAALVLLLAALAAAPAHAQAFGRNKVIDGGTEWRVLRTEHVDVYHDAAAGELARIAAAEAEAAYADLRDRFATDLAERVPLIVYATNTQFKQTNVLPGFIPDGVGGFFEFLKGRVVIPADGNVRRFRRVIRHELVHVFTFNKLARVGRDHRRTPSPQLPLWFTEGIAEYWSGPPDATHEFLLRDAVASNFLVPLHDLDRIAGSFLMYKQGEAFCRFVSEEYGEERLLGFVDEAWRDNRFAGVIEFVLGEPLDAVSDRWEAWLRAQYLPDIEGASPPALLGEAVAGVGFNAKPAVHTLADGTREVVVVSNRGSYTSVLAQPVDARLRPVGRPRTVVRAERTADYEALHPFESRMSVSADGLLAFVARRGGADRIHLHSLRTHRPVAALGFERLTAIYSPSLSADGRRIVFTGIDRRGFSDLYLVDRDAAGASALRQLTHDAYDDRDPDLSPDGQRVVFASDRTAWGATGHTNLFVLDVETGAVRALTDGPTEDASPRWSPDGDRVAFTRAARGPDGRFSSADVYTLDARPAAPALARTPTGGVPGGADRPEPAAAPRRGLARHTRTTARLADPVWADDERLVVAAFENFRFTVRALADSLAPGIAVGPLAAVPWPAPAGHWEHPRLDAPAEAAVPVRRRYALDFASGGLTAAPSASYSAGGATAVFSDLFGDDRIFVTAYSANAADSGRSLLEGLNVSVTRLHLGRRAQLGYGGYRLAGPRFDRTDPQAPAQIPSYEQQVGAVGLVRYPLSFFRRVELLTSFGLGTREGLRRGLPGGVTAFDTLRTGTLSNTLALVHDNALYAGIGPVEGWRASLSAGYTTDVLYANESYVSLGADVRRYTRLAPGVSVASWGLVRANVGRRARLNLLGGSWDLRGFPFLRVRGQQLWFTSHELRFPVLPRPPVYPLLTSVRGAVFVDAAHNWNGRYNERRPDPDFDAGGQLLIGSTKGSVGAGLRGVVLGAFVLRYDAGWRFLDGFDWSARQPFGQFFFGFDF